jgi:hypothetical protein
MSMWMIFLKVAGGSVGRGRGEIHRLFHRAGIFNQVVRKIDRREIFWQWSGAWPK